MLSRLGRRHPHRSTPCRVGARESRSVAPRSRFERAVNAIALDDCRVHRPAFSWRDPLPTPVDRPGRPYPSPRSRPRYPPDRSAERRPRRCDRPEGVPNETDLPAQPPQARQDPRFPCPHEDQGRPQRHQASPSQGTHAAHRIGPVTSSAVLRSLTEDRDFQRLRRGRSGSANHLSIRWRPRRNPPAGDAAAQGTVRVGIVVSKKVGNAVIRNRVRRRLREALRALLRERALEASTLDLVIIARPSAAEADYWDLDAALRRALGRGGLL